MFHLLYLPHFGIQVKKDANLYLPKRKKKEYITENHQGVKQSKNVFGHMERKKTKQKKKGNWIKMLEYSISIIIKKKKNRLGNQDQQKWTWKQQCF